ncbi:MAG TPA: YceI family protein [Vicinamibacterales bacterium]|nr:YceI family protein [Vicinamibacterales bacterium]
MISRELMAPHQRTWLVGLIVMGCICAPRAQDRTTFKIRMGTNVTVQVAKSGLLSFAGHDHEIVAPATEGQIVFDRADVSRSSVRLVFDATAAKVTGKGEPAEDVPEVQRVMQSDRVLDVKKYPTITFESRSVSRAASSGAAMTLRIEGDLMLHGMTRRVTAQGVQVRTEGDRLTAEGKLEVRQSDFGIRPVTAAGGTVRVKDEVTILFAITADRE